MKQTPRWSRPPTKCISRSTTSNSKEGNPMKFFLLLFLTLPAVISARCLPVTGDRIVGADLASADTEFATLPATLQLGYAPSPGASRVFTAIELQRIARANGIQATDFT